MHQQMFIYVWPETETKKASLIFIVASVAVKGGKFGNKVNLLVSSSFFRDAISNRILQSWRHPDDKNLVRNEWDSQQPKWKGNVLII